MSSVFFWRADKTPRPVNGLLTPLAGLFICCLLLLPTAAYAAGTITVDTPTDDFGGDGGSCALREAVESANSDSDFGGCTRTGTAPYTIALPAGEHLLTLPGASEDVNATGDLDLHASMAISGAGAIQSIIQSGVLPAPGLDRVLHITSSVTITITGVTIRNGATATTAENGGGIANMGGATLRLIDSIVSGNSSQGDEPGEGGGGIFNDVNSTLFLSNTNVISNSAIVGLGNGGGIFNGGTLAVQGGEITNNRAARAGGGIETNGGSVLLTAVGLNDNTANINGGGLHISANGVVTLTGGTANGNVAAQEGGALWNSQPGLLSVENVTISGNRADGSAADQGGGGIFSDGGTLTISNTNIISNTAPGTSGSGGGILIVPGSALTITGGTISNNSASRAGGGIEANATVTNSVTAALSNVTLNFNQTGTNPGNGGALHITGPANVTVTGGEVISNTASAEGGGLWNSAVGTLTISGTVVSANSAAGNNPDQGGGGLFNDGGTLIVFNSTISDNRATGTAGSGGGILVVPGGTLTLSESTLENNQATRAGGGIEVNATVTNTVAITVTGVDLLRNVTGANPGNGGGLHITGPGTALVSRSNVLSNTASAEGGGLWNSAVGTLTVSNTLVSGNVATGNDADQGGGGLYNDGGVLNVIASQIRNNQASGTAGSGGGILNKEGSLTISGGAITGNRATRAGGGIEDNGGTVGTTVIVAGVMLNANETGANPGNGGGLHITGAGNVTVTMSSVITNSASAEGGGLWNSTTGRLVVDKSTISDNLASGTAADQGGGALFNDGGTLQVSNSTVSANQAAAAGGGLKNLGTANLTNVTFYENGSDNGAGGISNSAGITLSNSIIAHTNATGADCGGVTAGDFNLDSDGSCQAAITGDPRFSPLQNNEGPTLTHALAFGSPAIDVGDPAICAAPPINNQDQRGETRPVGAACDLGAYEGGAATLVILFPLILVEGP